MRAKSTEEYIKENFKKETRQGLRYALSSELWETIQSFKPSEEQFNKVERQIKLSKKDIEIVLLDMLKEHVGEM